MPVNNRSQLLGFSKSYAFVIGIDHYPKINQDLKSAVNDAREIARMLKHRQGFDHVELFIDPLPGADRSALRAGLDGIEVSLDAKGQTIRDLLARIQDPEREPKIQPDECVLFYYAGHGKPGEFGEGPAGYLLPSDTRPEKAMLENDSLVPMEDVFQALKTLDCHHTLLILDCCFAGKFRLINQNTRAGGWVTDLPLYEERFQRYVNERAWQVLVSAGPHQTAADWVGVRAEPGEGQHSPFAEALIEALDGKGRVDRELAGRSRGDGVLTSQELFLHLWDRVERLTNDGEFDRDIQYPDLFPMSSHRGGQFIFFDPDNKLNFAERVLRDPYQGLQPFDPDKSDLFFGRSTVIREILGKLTETDVLLLSGPSGCGKSSLAKAGIYPHLRNWTDTTGELPWADAELIVLRPSGKPWSGGPVYDTKSEPPRLLYYSGLETALSLLDPTRPQVLLFDQYEELFTEGATAEERERFEEALLDLYRRAASDRLKLIVTLRSDYEWDWQESTVGQALPKDLPLTTFLYRVPPLTMDELREALVLPAQAELYDFETEGLVQTILAEIGYAPGALPMLSFTMSRFYAVTDKDERIFTSPAYRKIGGVNGALSNYADECYVKLGKEFSTDHQATMRKLFLRMVKLTGTGYGRRRVYVRPGVRFADPAGPNFLNEFDYADQHDAAVREVLDFLEAHHLITGGADRIGTYFEPAHDALIQHWSTGKQWIADFGTDNFELQRQLWQAVLDSTRRSSAPLAFNAYGATADDGVAQDERLTGNFSKLWESNAKLLQVIRQVTAGANEFLLAQKQTIIDTTLPDIAAEDQDKFLAFWDDCHDKGAVPDLNSLVLSGYSDQLLDLCLQHGDHWLNQAESDFIRQSWDKRIADVLDMKRQRDEALAAQKKIQLKNEQIIAAIETANTSGQRLKQQILAGHLDLDAKDIHGQLVLTSIILDNAREREGEQKTAIRRGDYDGDLGRDYIDGYLAAMHAEMGPELQRVGKLRMASEWIELVPFKSAPNAITYLQFFLCQAGLLNRENMTKIQGWGIYGYETLAALRLFQEYERTEGGNTAIGVPNGVVGAATWQAVLRWSAEGLRYPYGTAAAAEPSDEFTNWLSFVNSFRDFLKRYAGPAARAIEAHPAESDTRKLHLWNAHPQDTHIIGIRRQADRTATNRPNDDLFLLLVNGKVFKFWGSTDPNPRMARHRPDEAYLAAGQHQYRLGWHKRAQLESVYRALLPATRGVLVFRDRDNDDALTGADRARGLDPQPNPTINFHWSGAGRVNFSGGTQVVAGMSYGTPEGEIVDCGTFAASSPRRVDDNNTQAAYNVFMDLIVTNCPAGQYIFYTLIDEPELTIPPGIFPADYAAQWVDRLRSVLTDSPEVG